MIPSPSASEQKSCVISVEGVTFVYENGVQALNGVNLRVSKGEYLAIVGGNGSGKTTLAKTFNGLLRPTRGAVRIDGRPTSGMRVAEIARVVGYAFQNPDHQLFCSTVEEEVRFGPTNLGFPEAAISAKAESAIASMELEDLRKSPPLSLRLGERRRVSIASVLSMDTEVLILDEPTTGLDAEESAELMEKLRLLNEEGRTIILITHDMKLVAEHARRVVVMSGGRVALDTDPRGAFSDLDLIRQSNLEPPAVTLLSHKLAGQGVPQDIISPEEFVLHVLRIRGGG